MAVQFDEMERREIGENVFETSWAIVERLEASHGPEGHRSPTWRSRQSPSKRRGGFQTERPERGVVSVV